MCESIPGWAWSVWRMLVVQRALGHMLLDCRHFMQGSLVRLQITFVCDSTVTVLCLCVWTQPHIQNRHPNRTWNTVELDIIQFVLRSWWRSESCTECWLWCTVLYVGVDRTADVSTRRLGSECSLPWHVWIDSRMSVKCVKDARCAEGSWAHVVRL